MFIISVLLLSSDHLRALDCTRIANASKEVLNSAGSQSTGSPARHDMVGPHMSHTNKNKQHLMGQQEQYDQQQMRGAPMNVRRDGQYLFLSYRSLFRATFQSSVLI